MTDFLFISKVFVITWPVVVLYSMIKLGFSKFSLIEHFYCSAFWVAFLTCYGRLIYRLWF